MRALSGSLLLLLALATQGCCSSSSDAGAAKARELTQAELQSLYEEMAQYKGEYIFWGEHFSPLPEEFARVGALHGDVGHLDRLVFGGCMDDKAMLIFEGLDGGSARQIRLIPGERKAVEILWRDLGSAASDP